MESVPAKIILILRMNPAAYGWKLQWFPTAPWFAISRSDVICLIRGIYCGVRQPNLHDCHIWIGHCMREWMSADFCVKESQGYSMKVTLAIMSGCIVSLTIPIVLTVKREMLLCSRWVNVPTLTWKTPLASRLSISRNIQHLAQQQSQCKLQWSILWRRTFRHFWQG